MDAVVRRCRECVGGERAPVIEGSAQGRPERRTSNRSSERVTVAVSETSIDGDAQRVEAWLSAVHPAWNEGAARVPSDCNLVTGRGQGRAERVDQRPRRVEMVGPDPDGRRCVRGGRTLVGLAVEQQAAAEALHGFAGSALQTSVVRHVSPSEQVHFLRPQVASKCSAVAGPRRDRCMVPRCRCRVISERGFDVDDEAADETANVRGKACRVEEQIERPRIVSQLGFLLEFAPTERELVPDLDGNGPARVGEVEDDPRWEQPKARGDGGGIWMHRARRPQRAPQEHSFAGRMPARIGPATRLTQPPCRSSAGWPQPREGAAVLMHRCGCLRWWIESIGRARAARDCGQRPVARMCYSLVPAVPRLLQP